MAINLRSRTATTYREGASADVDVGLRKYMLSVYNYMAMGVALTGVVTLTMANMPDLMYTLAVGPAKWVLFIALLGMGFMSTKIITMKSTVGAQAFFWVYCAMWGVMISPMIYAFLGTPGGILDIARAFFITAGMFAGMSLFGYTTKKDLSGFGRFAVMAVIGIIIAGLVNAFFVGSSEFAFIMSLVTVLLFAGITAWETQMIKNMYQEHYGMDVISRFAIFGALQLYGSFVVMFIHILSIFGAMRE
ncbi:MAG: Bax inhibitor-1/YccA family protein [Alphaproteobacteria bacterium]